MFTTMKLDSALWLTGSGVLNAENLPGHIASDDINGRSAPANITTVLTIINVNISNNGADYICAQGIVAKSNAVFLTVFGE